MIVKDYLAIVSGRFQVLVLPCGMSSYEDFDKAHRLARIVVDNGRYDYASAAQSVDTFRMMRRNKVSLSTGEQVVVLSNDHFSFEQLLKMSLDSIHGKGRTIVLVVKAITLEKE